MYLKPRKLKTTLAFMAGLSISLVLLAGGVYWYRHQQIAMMEQIGTEIRSKVEMEWEATHPLEVVYVFAADMKAGMVLDEQDLVLLETGNGMIPSDAVRTPEEVVGRVMRNDVKANTLCIQSLIYQQGDYPDDARIQEYSAIRLPQRLDRNQSVDVRIMFPNGLDYVVLTKKNVLDLQRDEAGIGNLVWLTVSEEELLRMSSAVVDAFLHPGTILYAVTYVAPDIQVAAKATYPANAYVQELIQSNPNILANAVNELERANRRWFDSIPDPQPQQPMAIVPAPSLMDSTVLAAEDADASADGATEAGTDEAGTSAAGTDQSAATGAGTSAAPTSGAGTVEAVTSGAGTGKTGISASGTSDASGGVSGASPTTEPGTGEGL